MFLTDNLLQSIGLAKPFLTIDEVAEVLCVPTRSVRKALRERELGSHSFAGEIRISKEQLQIYIETARTDTCRNAKATEMMSSWSSDPRAPSGKYVGTMQHAAKCATSQRGRRIELKPKGSERNSYSDPATKPIRRRKPHPTSLLLTE
jgi:excisionase family DNA binding protein